MKENTSRTQINTTKLPKVKGHTKITLRDVETGEVEVHESDNMVTNAVARIFANNYGNSLDVADGEITPLNHLFGGVMCFNSQLTESANNIFPPSEGANALIAHGGSNTEAAHTNAKLGARTLGVPITGGWRWKWEWSTAQGIGTINACALTSEAGGNVGLTPVTRDFPATIYKSIRNIALERASTNTLDWAKNMLIAYDRETGIGRAIFYSQTKVNNLYTITEYTMKHPTLKFGLTEGAADWEIIKTRTVGITDKMGEYHAFYADGENYYLLYRYSTTQIKGYKLEPYENTFNLTAVQFGAYTGVEFAPLPYDVDIKYDGASVAGANRTTSRYGAIPIHNGFIYFLNSDQTKLIRVTLATPANFKEITTEVAEQVFHNLEPAYWCGDFCVGYDFIINAVGTEAAGPIEKLYPISPSEKNGGDSSFMHHFLSYADTPALLDETRPNSSSGTPYGYQGVGIFAPYLATINNLSQPITKSPSQTMEITYDLTIVEE